MLIAISSIDSLSRYTSRTTLGIRFFRSLLISLLFLALSLVFKKFIISFQNPFRYQEISFTTFDKPSHISKILDIFDERGLDIHRVKISSLGNNRIKMTLLVKKSRDQFNESLPYGSVTYIAERLKDK